MMFGLKRISTALGLLALTASAAMAQGIAPNANQMTADAVANSLRGTRGLERSRIEIQAQGGFVTLTGMLASPNQKADALARASRVAGVRGVIDQIQISNDRTVLPVQYQPNLGIGPNGGGYPAGDTIVPGSDVAVGGPVGGAPIISDG